jgi:hypothetical protein
MERRSLEDLRVWYANDDFALAVAAVVGIERWTVRTDWRIGGQDVSVSLERRDADLRCFFAVHGGSTRRTLALHEVYGATIMGEIRTLRGPEARRWKLRALVELGFKEAAPVDLIDLHGAPPCAVEVWSAIARLLAIRWLEEQPGSPFVLSAPWFSRWTGLPEATIRTGKTWLERHGHIERTGTCPGSFGKAAILWRLSETHLPVEHGVIAERDASEMYASTVQTFLRGGVA